MRLVIGLLGWLALVAQAVELVPLQVSEHAWYFRGQAGMASKANEGFMSNAGFVVTKDGVIVFDALATPVLGAAMLKAIATVTPLPVKRVIISHYHADHFYGLQSLNAPAWAHLAGKAALASDQARDRLAQRRADLGPWVNADTRLVSAERWLDFAGGDVMAFEFGGLHFRIINSAGTHSEGDILLAVDEDQLIFAGDLFATGRIPFVGDANSKLWLAALERMQTLQPKVVVPGHGEVSRAVHKDMQLTRDYLHYLREKMGAAVAELTPFEEAYAKTDWSRFAKEPAFDAANRLNAYGTYLLMEKESLQK